jgi:hypothetical protein
MWRVPPNVSHEMGPFKKRTTEFDPYDETRERHEIKWRSASHKGLLDKDFGSCPTTAQLAFQHQRKPHVRLLSYFFILCSENPLFAFNVFFLTDRAAGSMCASR